MLSVFLPRFWSLLLNCSTRRQPGAPMQSLFLSQERVDLVSSELLALNLKVITVRGFGGTMTLLDASQPSSRHRNERVEVWLR